jgi:parallel beta-helix repeat protein
MGAWFRPLPHPDDVTPMFATQLIGFGLRQVIDVEMTALAGAVSRYLSDHGQALPRALARAHDRSWQALGIALAGDGFVEQVRVFFASGDDKGVREQVRAFLQANAAWLDTTPAAFRQQCLAELRRLRASGRLAVEGLSASDLARQASAFERHTRPETLIEQAQAAVGQVADALAPDCPNLARLLRTPAPGGPPLLAGLFAYFFRREVETDEELAHGLFFDGLRQLSSTQGRAFIEVNKALTGLGDRFDAVMDQLERVEQAAIEARAAAQAAAAAAASAETAALDLQAEMQRLAGLHLASAAEVRGLLAEVIERLAQHGMQRGEVRPQHSLSIRGEDERRVVKALLARFRQLPAAEQQQVPALLNGLGKLQVGTGDFGGARQTFDEVAGSAGPDSARAEARFNASRAALEQRQWDEALLAIQEAARLDARFEPFPLRRYRPRRILGAGGFGTAILCHDQHFDEDVVVKTLHVAELESGIEQVFREARVLRKLSHPAVVGVRDCDWADPASRARPFLVMDYFPGITLEQYVAQQGPLAPQDLLPVASAIAHGMQAAHGQGVLHRDLKPANILVRRTPPLSPEGRGVGGEGDWQVKVIDFGLALARHAVETSRAAHSSGSTILGTSVAGTLKYAPPEQMGELRGVKPGPYSDVYAFGKTCCYALFGTTEPKRRQWASIPDALADLLEKATEQDLSHRHPGFEPVLAALDQVNAQRDRCIVSPQGDGTHRTIGEAIRDAAPGAEIRIRPGVYREGIVLDREVTLTGDGPVDQIIVESAQADCILMATDRATVRGLTLRCTAGQQERRYFGVDIPRGRLELIDCDISSDSLACVGIHSSAADPLLRGCKIHDGKSTGLFIYDLARGTIEDCEVFGNGLAGISISQGSDPTIRRCKVCNGKGSGLFVYEQGKGTIEDCDIADNTLPGIEVKLGGQPLVRACKVRDGQQSGIYVHTQGKGTFESCDVFGNAKTGVHVKDGSDPVLRHCKVHDGKTTGVNVHSQGKGTFEGCDFFGNALADIEIREGGDPILRHCTIHDSQVGGVFVYKQGKGTLESCDIFGCGLPGFEVKEGGDPVVRNCKIRDGKQSGVSIHNEGKGTFENCTISSNRAGVVVRQGGQGTFQDCDIAGSTLAGIEVREGGDPTVRSCKVRDGKQSGVYVHSQGKGTFEGCSISNNARSGVTIKKGGDPTIRKCRIRRNGLHGVFASEGGLGTVESCNLGNNLMGAFSIAADCPVVRRGNQE